MSIIDWAREGGISGFDIECDTCGQSDFFDDDRFCDAIEHAKRYGWKIAKDDAGEWMHLCPTCAGELRRELARQDRDDTDERRKA